jgi:prepilin-type N-terminal cleavage/methylation domain-containing protein
MSTVPDLRNAGVDGDSGLSLVEVLVAMMIFAMISIGVAFSLVTMMTQVRDTRAREVASNLASQEIDLARGGGDVFGLLDSAYPPVTVNGVNFQVQRTTRWVTDPSSDGACGVGSSGVASELRYKRVHVAVTWTSTGASTRQVSADTLIAPKSRVSSSSAGTLLVSVLDAAGVGIPGVTVSTTPTISPAPSATDAQGCIYIPNVPPATYTVQVTSPGYVNSAQQPTPSITGVTVGAGKSGTFPFVVALNLPLIVNYGAALIPKDLDTSFLHAADPVFVSTTSAVANPRTVQLFPFVENYTVIAGKYRASNSGTAGCKSPNPAEWPVGVVAGKTVTGVAPLGVRPGIGASTVVPMGSLLVSSLAVDDLTAVSQTTPQAGTGDPGCAAVTMTYHFGTVLKTGVVTVSLPYGTWQLYKGTSTLTKIMTGIVSAPGTTAVVSGAGIVTLDPRIVLP